MGKGVLDEPGLLDDEREGGLLDEGGPGEGDPLAEPDQAGTSPGDGGLLDPEVESADRGGELDEGEKGGEEEGGDSLPDALTDYFSAHLDEDGRLPPGADQYMAGVENRTGDDGREAYYAAVPGPRTEDYKNKVLKLMPYTKDSEDEPDLFMKLADGSRYAANKGIRLLNELTGSNIEEMAMFRSNEDSDLVAWLGQYGPLMAMGAASAPVLAMAGAGFAAVGLTAVGITGLHAAMAAHDDPDKMEEYDSVLTMAGWEGLIPSDTEDMGHLEKAGRIWVAETLDTLALGAALKGGKHLWRIMRGLDESGNLVLRSRAAEAAGEKPSWNKLMTLTEEEDAIFRAQSDEQLEAYLSDFATRVTNDPEVMAAFRKLRTVRESVDYVPDRMDRLIGDVKDMGERLDSAMKPEVLKSLDSRGAWDRVVAAKLPVNASKASVANMRNDVYAYVGGLRDEMDRMAAKVPEGGEALVDTVKDKEIVDLMGRRKILAEKLMDTKFVRDPGLERALRLAKGYTSRMAEMKLLVQGVKARIHEGFDDTLKQLEIFEDEIARFRLKSYSKEGLSVPENTVLKKAEKRWDALHKRMEEGTDRWWETTAAVANKAHYDNLLAGGALKTSLFSGIIATGLELAYRTTRKGGFRAIPSNVSRMMSSLGERMRGWNLKETGEIWSGTKIPRHFEKYNFKREYKPQGWKERMYNRVTGTSRLPMYYVDDALSAAQDAISETSALDRLLRDTAPLTPRKGQTVTLDESKAKMLAQVKKVTAATKDPEQFMRDNPDWAVKYVSEVNFRTDAILMRADPDDYPDPGILGQIGNAIYDWTGRSFHQHRNPVRSLGGAVALGPFPRIFANILQQIDHNSITGLVRFEALGTGLGKTQKGLNLTPRLNRFTERRKFGTLVGAAALAYANWDDNVSVVNNVSDRDLYRKHGGHDGVDINGRFWRWDEFGQVGLAVGALRRIMDALRVIPPTGTAMAWLGADGYSEHGIGNRVGRALWHLSEALVQDTAFDRAFSTLTFGLVGGNVGVVERYAKEMWGKAANPGMGAVNRVTTMIKGHKTPRAGDADDWGWEDMIPGGKTLVAIKELLTVADALDTVEPSRDLWGVSMADGDNRDETSLAVDAYDRFMVILDPTHEGGRSKTMEVRNFLADSGAFRDKSFVVGDKVIPDGKFNELFGFDPPSVNEPSRQVSVTVGNGIRKVSLSPRGYNDKKTLMSMDWEAVERVLDRYEHHYDKTPPGPGMERDHREAVWRLNNTRQQVNFSGMSSFFSRYNGDYDEGTRLIDVVHHLATAPIESLPQYSRDMIRMEADAMAVAAAESRRVNDTLQGVTDDEITETAERLARIFMIQEVHDHMEAMAEAVMEYSPEADGVRQDHHNQEQEQ